MMVATPVFFVSCGNDDDMLPEESEITKPTIASWTEPFHDKNGTPDKVKSYMASLMSRYSLVTENAGTSSTQLVYSSASLSEGGHLQFWWNDRNSLFRYRHRTDT
jgi:hypothetical protein